MSAPVQFSWAGRSLAGSSPYRARLIRQISSRSAFAGRSNIHVPRRNLRFSAGGMTSRSLQVATKNTLPLPPSERSAFISALILASLSPAFLSVVAPRSIEMLSTRLPVIFVAVFARLLVTRLLPVPACPRAMSPFQS